MARRGGGDGPEGEDTDLFGDTSGASSGAKAAARSSVDEQDGGPRADLPAPKIRSFVSPTVREDRARARARVDRRGRAGGRAGGRVHRGNLSGKGSYRPSEDVENGALGSVDFARQGSAATQETTRSSDDSMSEHETGQEGASEGRAGKKKGWVWKPAPTRPRDVAFQVLMKRETGGTTTFIEALLQEGIAASALSPADRALCKEIVLGCVRWRDMLDQLVAYKQTAPAKGRSRQGRSRKQLPAVRCLLRIGLYQIALLDKIPSHAAVSETVGLASRCGYKDHAGFVNAVLRAYADDPEGTTATIDEMQAAHPAVGWSHPPWLVEQWVKRYGSKNATRLMAWNNMPAASYARVNRLRVAPQALRSRWEAEGVVAEPVPLAWGEEGDIYQLTLPTAVDALPSFQDGLFYMQDPSTLLAVHALDAQPGELVIDLCAAPGGKSCMIAQRMGNTGTLVASDIDAERLVKVQENCVRLGVTCIETAPAEELEDTLRSLVGGRLSGGLAEEGEGRGLEIADRVLIDAPCSNTGVMRRRVDLRWRLQQEEVQALHQVQFGLLQRAARLVKPGGVVVHSTCSIEPDENEHVVRRFLKMCNMQVPGSWELEYSRQASPLTDATDGAYVARLRRLV